MPEQRLRDFFIVLSTSDNHNYDDVLEFFCKNSYKEKNILISNSIYIFICIKKEMFRNASANVAINSLLNVAKEYNTTTDTTDIKKTNTTAT